MNIFFNSRINANQSLLNVLFGQQQKAASSQNTVRHNISAHDTSTQIHE